MSRHPVGGATLRRYTVVVVVALPTMAQHAAQKASIVARCAGSRHSRDSTGFRNTPSLRRLSWVSALVSHGSAAGSCNASYHLCAPRQLGRLAAPVYSHGGAGRPRALAATQHMTHGRAAGETSRHHHPGIPY